MAESLKKEKGQFHVFQCDVAKEDQILAMFQHIKQQHGGVDICVNNAGLAHDAPLLSGDTDQWRNMFEVSLQILDNLFTLSTNIPCIQAGHWSDNLGLVRVKQS